ncbi:MAG TPA: hypothetical protein VJO53_14700 [Candidatus Acidoferrales bacterium]|nr:hypothetical protein [Candidatus Acidoferrales bacterium]
MILSALWRRITSTRYTRALETEVVRARAENLLLRDENRALLNSILALAGTPPAAVAAPPVAPPVAPASSPRFSAPPPPSSAAASPDAAPCSSSARGFSRSATPPLSSEASALDASPRPATRPRARTDAKLPLRRPSWHQITRILEMESAKKPASGD